MLTGIDLHAQARKILVVYFSQSGNTREVASQIKNAVGGEVFELIPEKPYTDNYSELTKQAKQEIESAYRPALKSKISKIESYDTIFVGSPCWWSTIAPPVVTFLAENDLSGKTLIPFMTHEGSQLGHAIQDIKKLCPDSKVLDGLAIRGSQAKNSQNEVMKWLQKNKMMK